jgi:endonuclease/exonuclease/phosphatase (EEP) superfamily protein YafD
VRPPPSRRLTAVLTAAALVLLVWDALCFVDSGSQIAAVLTSLAPFVSLLALPVLAVAAAGRRWVPVGMAVVAAAVPWVLVFGSSVAGPGPTATPDQRNVLRVMTVHGDGASGVSVVRAVRSQGADVLVVTGLDSRLAHDLTVAGLHSMLQARWVRVDHAGQGVGLWSNAPVLSEQPAPVPGTAGRSVTGTMHVGTQDLSVTLADAGGGLVPSRTWRSDLRALNAAHRTGPRLLVGNLGASPWHPAVRGLGSGRWRDAVDVLGRGLRPTWPGWSPLPLVPLEQVLVGGGLGVQSADSAAIVGSSHRALVVSVILPGARSPADT